MTEPAKNPLARLPGEPSRWYEVFLAFAHAGPGRSMLKIYNQRRDEERKSAVQTIPGAWQESAKKYRWRERAEAFDLIEQDKIKAEFEEAKKTEREKRFALLQAGRKKLERVIRRLNPKDCKWSEASGFLRAIFGEYREEIDTASFEERLKKLEESTK